MIYSSYQNAIFDEIAKRSGNVGVNAVAGSGKTTTIVEGIKRNTSACDTVLMAAFGKDIAENLKTKNLPSHVDVATYNAFGWGICRRYGRPRLDKDKKTERILQYKVMGVQFGGPDWKRFCQLRWPISRIISLLKGQCVFDVDEAASMVNDLIEHYGIEVPTDKDLVELVAKTYDYSIHDLNSFDFDDQIFQVLKQDYDVPAYDLVFVDEFQDTNEMQARMMQKACAGNFYAVGDPDQAIYGFRGSTPNAFGKFMKNLDARELPLSICYRCPKAVVRYAKTIVSRIEESPTQIEGLVDDVTTSFFLKRVKPGDFVLCRTVAPLVKRCLQLIREKVPAFILGREIGDSLEYLIDKIATNDNMPVESFEMALTSHVQDRLDYYNRTGNKAQAMALEDRFDTILSLADGCRQVGDVKLHLQKVFSQKQNAVQFMTVHKSKGLENPTVWILRPDLIPHPRSVGIDWMGEEERRLKYVATTRSQGELFFVEKERGEK